MPPQTFQPLTKEQYESARANGFSHEQIMVNEERRKSEVTPVPQATPPPESMAGVAKGALKSLGSTALAAPQGAEWLMNQTAGRVVSGVTGRGFVPLPKQDLKYSTESPLGAKLHDAVEPKNFSEKLGYYGTELAQIAVPGVGGLKVATKVPEATKALQAVTAKPTPTLIKEAYKQGRAGVGGILRRVGLTPDARTQRAAEVTKGIVKGKTAAEDSAAVYKAIGDEAQSLRTALRSREIQPIVQQEELSALYQKALQEIGEDPTMVGDATESASRIFRKFQSYLPKDRPINAEDILDARQKTDQWVEGLSKKVFDPKTQSAVSIALNVIRRGANDLLISKADDVAVKASFEKQSALYDALANIATKAPAELGTTAPGRYLARHPFQKEIVKGVAGALPLGIGGYILGKTLGD